MTGTPPIETPAVADAGSPKRGGEGSFEAGAIRRMYCVDTSNNPRIPILMEMVGAVSRATRPQEIYDRFIAGMRKISNHTAYLALSVRGLEPGEYKITRFDRREESGRSQLVDDPWTQWKELETRRGGFLGELIRSAWPELIHHLDVREDSAVGDLLAPYQSMMAVPIFDRGEPLNWAIMLNDQPEAYTMAELEESVLRANLVGGMTRNTVVSQQLVAAQRRIHHELERIGAIQRALLPDPLPAIHGVEIAASYETSERAGGDYYDFFALDRLEDRSEDPNGRWGIIVADASGHGPSAAVVMAMLHAIMHAFAQSDHSPASILEHANRQLCAKNIESSFVTAFYGIYDASRRTLQYARAGHNPPLLHSGTTCERFDAVGGLPLGVERDTGFDDHTVQLSPGQTIVFYTDGITEAMDNQRQMFGLSGIERALQHCDGTAACTVETINAALLEHQGDDPIADDQTIVAMRILDVE